MLRSNPKAADSANHNGEGLGTPLYKSPGNAGPELSRFIRECRQKKPKKNQNQKQFEMEITIVNNIFDNSLSCTFKGLDHKTKARIFFNPENDQNRYRRIIIMDELFTEFVTIQKYRTGNFKATNNNVIKLQFCEELKLQCNNIVAYIDERKFNLFINYADKVIMPILLKIFPHAESHLFSMYEKRLKAIENLLDFSKNNLLK